MRLVRNTTTDGKYALVRLDKLRLAQKALDRIRTPNYGDLIATVQTMLKSLENLGLLEYGIAGNSDEFFAIKLKDCAARAALEAYASAIQEHDAELAADVLELAERASEGSLYLKTPDLPTDPDAPVLLSKVVSIELPDARGLDTGWYLLVQHDARLVVGEHRDVDDSGMFVSEEDAERLSSTKAVRIFGPVHEALQHPVSLDTLASLDVNERERGYTHGRNATPEVGMAGLAYWIGFQDGLTGSAYCAMSLNQLNMHAKLNRIRDL